MIEEPIKKIIKDFHSVNNSSKEINVYLSELFRYRADLHFDHPWLPEINNTIANAQILLQIKKHEESSTLWSLAKRGLVTETLKFMVPFILGVLVAIYGSGKILEINKYQDPKDGQTQRS